MSKPKSGLAKYLSELRYRMIWAKEARQSSAAAKAALADQNNPTIAEVKSFLCTLTPHHCGIDLVRIGPDEDGGYLLPDDLNGIEALFSPGVSETLGDRSARYPMFSSRCLGCETTGVTSKHGLYSKVHRS